MQYDRLFKDVEVNSRELLDKMFLDIISSFKTCRSSLLHLLMALRRSLPRIDEASLFETFGSLKITNFGYTPSLISFYSFCTLVLHIGENILP